MGALHALRRHGGGGFPVPILDLLLGGWLLISAFVWPHTRTQLNNALILGVVVMAVAAFRMVAPGTRPLNALAGFWLFVSAQALPSMTAATAVNNVLVGLAIFVVSLTPWYGAAGSDTLARSG